MNTEGFVSEIQSYLRVRNLIFVSVDIMRYLCECSCVCILVFMLHDQILERQVECDKVSVVKCGSLFNKTSKRAAACLTYANICQRCSHLETLMSADKCVNKALAV